MSFELEKIVKAKREMRQRLATLPIVEKLALLDALRERALTIAQTRQTTQVSSGGDLTLRERPPQYGAHNGVKTRP